LSFDSDHAAVGAQHLTVDPSAFGPTRKETAEAISPGVPRRSIGFIFAKRSISSGVLPLRNNSVATGPGATALTAMLRPRNSFDRIAVMVSTADLVAA